MPSGAIVRVRLVEAAGRGSYRLGPNGAGLAADISAWRKAEQRVRARKGGSVAAHVGNPARSDRVALRARSRAQPLVGMCELKGGLFVRPDNVVGGVAEVRARLHNLGLQREAAVFLVHELDPAREARALWDGEKLTKSYRQTRQRVEKWCQRADRLEPDVAARAAFLLGNQAIRQLVFDPALPEPLVDSAERRAFVDAVVELDRVGRLIWQRRLGLAPESAKSARTPRTLETA
jgi:phenylacetic acid degradation operon negative regulatory protein